MHVKVSVHRERTHGGYHRPGREEGESLQEQRYQRKTRSKLPKKKSRKLKDTTLPVETIKRTWPNLSLTWACKRIVG